MKSIKIPQKLYHELKFKLESMSDTTDLQREMRKCWDQAIIEVGKEVETNENPT